MSDAVSTVKVPRGTRKAAVVVSLLPAEEQQRVVRRIAAPQRQKLEEALGQLDPQTTEELLDEVLRELDAVLQEQILQAPGGDGDGAPQAANVTEAAAPRSAGDTTQAIDSETTSDGKPGDPKELPELLERLQSLPAEVLASALVPEKPSVIAAVLPYLPEAAAAQLLGKLPPDKAEQAFLGLRRSRKLLPEVLSQLVRRVLLRAQETRATVRFTPAHSDPLMRMINLLRSMSSEERGPLLAAMEARDAEFAQQLRDNLYRFEDILRIADSCVQKILGEVDLRTIAVAIKDSPVEIKNKIASNLSKRVRQSLFEEIEMLGPVPPAKAREAQKVIRGLILEIDKRGELIMT
jgi:flagellar motor switch protein FliG